MMAVGSMEANFIGIIIAKPVGMTTPAKPNTGTV
jgi:hypothetical protein